MRPTRFKPCAKCGGEMVDLGKDKTVVAGTWYVIQCPKCLYTVDIFKPKRSRK